MFIAANWKMNLLIDEGVRLAEFIIKNYSGDKEVVLIPPSTHLHKIGEAIGVENFYLGAQNCYMEESGAFTGEISPKILKESLGCEYVILGHSERRKYFSETDEMVNKKSKAAISFVLKPIICIGETLEERKLGVTNEVLGKQIQNSIPDNASLDNYILAYEPVWAIGTGLTPTEAEIEDAHSFIREKIGQGVKILYGGSANDSNAKEITSINNVDGLLVGGASLDAEKFLKILNH